VQAILILTLFGIATGIIGRAKGSSFFIWFLCGFILPLVGLIAVIMFRNERDDPVRRCPRCGHIQRIQVQVCGSCGEDLYLPDPAETIRPSAIQRARKEARDQKAGVS
jgi:hypothetical protein